ncbi:hypothetical protein ACXHPP_14000, partial [Vibrio cincinnatiensis]
MYGIFEQLQFSLSITGPICLMLILGIFLKRIQLINLITTNFKLTKESIMAILFTKEEAMKDLP